MPSAPSHIASSLTAWSFVLLFALVRVPAAGSMPQNAADPSTGVIAVEAPYTASAIFPQWLMSAGSMVPADESRGACASEPFARTSQRAFQRAAGLENGMVSDFLSRPRYHLFCALLR